MKPALVVAAFAAIALTRGNLMALGADTKFNVKRFRANAASIVAELHDQLETYKMVMMMGVKSMPLGQEHAERIVETFFTTLPNYTETCNMEGAQKGYTVRLFVQDIIDHLPEIAKYYDNLEKTSNITMHESKCLSEHVIDFVLHNREVAKTILKLMKVVNKIRDEL